MYRGVFPFHFDNLAYQSRDELLQAVVKLLTLRGLVSTGDKVVITFGVNMGLSGHTDSMRVVTV